MPKFNKMVVVASLVLVLGAHWTILQSVAWVSMFIRYSQHESVTVALQKTFDGKHPCSICLFVEKGRQADKSGEQKLLTIEKLDLFLERTVVFDFSSDPLLMADSPSQPLSDLPQAPPYPPPRFA